MSELVCLAKIVAAHGIKGEVKLRSYTSDPKDVCQYGLLSNKDQTRFFDLKFMGFQKNVLRVKIKGIDTRNDAENLVGTDLYISREKLPKLEQDTFYQTDLVGLEATDQKTGKSVGKVVGVYNFGAGDILEIKFDHKKQTEMIPFREEYVPNVDLKKGVLVLTFFEMNYQKDEEDNA